ncbi:MAG: BREX-1 system phosphatase PglZ type A, partial [Clostridia bacterium]|nr:BREX-1 system phosphatase PglZ type A [Clostridia bacterium]
CEYRLHGIHARLPWEYRIEDIAVLNVSAKLLVLTGSNTLYAKALLESDDPTSCYLVYAPFARPADADFHLADTVHYSRVFSTDKITQLMQELRIPEGMKATLARYPLFWKSNARIEKFAALELDAYTATLVDTAVLCVQCGARVVSFDEVLKKVLGAGLEKGEAMLKTFESVGALSTFWQLCARYYGYEEPAPQLARLVATLLCTYTAAAHAALPERFRQYVTSRKNNVCVFLSNFMSGAQTRAAFDELSASFAQRLQIREAFEKLDAAQLLEVDAFAVADELLLARATALLLTEDLTTGVGGLSLPQLVQQRALSGLHFAQQFQAQYALLLHARTLIAAACQKPQYKTAKAMAEGYRRVLCEADTAYRKFTALYDRLPDQAPYEKLARLMERIYCNDLLDACTRQFSTLLADVGPAALGLPMQEHFAETYIRPRVGRERTFVIISDALRYECARELLKRLTDDEKCDATLDAALSTLPSITRLGMAALLPHRQICVSPDFTVTVDGLPCGDLASREKVLAASYPDGICLKLDAILTMQKKDLRERCNGKDVVYI